MKDIGRWLPGMLPGSTRRFSITILVKFVFLPQLHTVRILCFSSLRGWNHALRKTAYLPNHSLQATIKTNWQSSSTKHRTKSLLVTHQTGNYPVTNQGISRRSWNETSPEPNLLCLCGSLSWKKAYIDPNLFETTSKSRKSTPCCVSIPLSCAVFWSSRSAL